jgi:hypothetical protein
MYEYIPVLPFEAYNVLIMSIQIYSLLQENHSNQTNNKIGIADTCTIMCTIINGGMIKAHISKED